MRIKLAEPKSNDLVRMTTIGYDGTIYSQLWTTVKTRKKTSCEPCQTTIAKGDRAWRPVTNQNNRMWRLCTECVLGACYRDG